MTAELSLGGLGYVGVVAPDPECWRAFALDVCGLALARSPDAGDGTLLFRMDEHPWRIAVHPGDTAGLHYLGFEALDPAALAGAVSSWEKRGVTVREGTREECTARCVADLAVMQDPAGHRIEIFSGPARGEPFRSDHGTRFVTGALGMGHVVLYVPELEPALDFYRDVLGFHRSDYLNFGPGMGIHFLRCTPRHHSVALLHLGDSRGLQHLMLETGSLDDVGRALDRAQAAKRVITSSLGRHRNDGVVSFYMEGPSGFDVEIGWDGRLVGEDWVEKELAAGDVWGHHGLDAAIQRKED